MYWDRRKVVFMGAAGKGAISFRFCRGDAGGCLLIVYREEPVPPASPLRRKESAHRRKAITLSMKRYSIGFLLLAYN
jgi:hypothetical protein